MLFVIVLLLLLIVVLLGGGNILIGIVAFPVLLFLSVYLWGINGFVGSIVFLFLLPALPLFMAIFVMIWRSMNKERYSEDRFEFGKICDRCNEKAMNAAVACPKCKGHLRYISIPSNAEPLQPSGKT